MDKEKIRAGVRMILDGIGEDIHREGLVETPDRIARMYEELAAGYRDDAAKHLQKRFHVDNNDMVIKITRFWHKAYLGLGSNMGDKKKYLDQAVTSLDETRGCHVEKVSSYLVTKPYGGVEQDDFLNACLILKTFLPPQELLDRMHQIELEAHRERVIHWGPRTLDLDILLYDDEVMETDQLVIPHVKCICVNLC